jgi:triosephosphate isomerase (TIM)
MRKPIIAGNWKMNTDAASAHDLVQGIRDALEASNIADSVDVVLCPPYPFLSLAVQAAKSSRISIGAQNLHEQESGAYTGEVSAAMIRSLGCSHVIIGHSERRQYFGEDDVLVNRKLNAALSAGLKAIVCVGETLAEREAGKTLELVEGQVRAGLDSIPEAALEDIVLAYEPVWAIGTGKTATKEQAQEVHAQIRSVLAQMYSKELAESIRIQYGGSMKPGNANEILSQKDVDGGLIGGACLKSDSFYSIIEAASKTVM